MWPSIVHTDALPWGDCPSCHSSDDIPQHKEGPGFPSSRLFLITLTLGYQCSSLRTKKLFLDLKVSTQLFDYFRPTPLQFASSDLECWDGKAIDNFSLGTQIHAWRHRHGCVCACVCAPGPHTHSNITLQLEWRKQQIHTWLWTVEDCSIFNN